MSIPTLRNALNDTAAQIRRIEAEAQRLLLLKNDPRGYKAAMREKCFLLEELPGLAAPELTDVDPGLRGRIGAALAEFARKAGQALSLESVFYMYALLYPEDYQDGQPNDLERFIAEMERV